MRRTNKLDRILADLTRLDRELGRVTRRLSPRLDPRKFRAANRRLPQAAHAVLALRRLASDVRAGRPPRVLLRWAAREAVAMAEDILRRL